MLLFEQNSLRRFLKKVCKFLAKFFLIIGKIILMDKIALKLVSPERSRSIKLKVSNKMLPQDFFKRPTSQSPFKSHTEILKKVKDVRYLKEVINPKLNPEISASSVQYWDMMRQQLEKSRNRPDQSKLKHIQRIWVQSEKKNRNKLNKQTIHKRHQSKQQKRKVEQGIIDCSPTKSQKVIFHQGLITFMGKSGLKGLNFLLPAIK